ncbi:MAG: cobalamin-dependent protein [Anaerolineales bacterium]|nr:cobalamin-dependent protein [Anaerolineales bacterium]
MEVIVNKLADLEEDAVITLVKEKIDQGADPLLIFDACRRGMILVGEKYECKEYFISDLMMAAEIFKQISIMLEPMLAGKTSETRGAVVIGTVQGDIHDIGKNLVVGMLRAAGFNVHDLGVDVPPEKFIAALRETGASVLALSGLLTIAFDSMKATVEAVNQAGLNGVKVVIGGGPVTEDVKKYTGADAWGASAQAAVNQAAQWMEG